MRLDNINGLTLYTILRLCLNNRFYVSSKLDLVIVKFIIRKVLQNLLRVKAIEMLMILKRKNILMLECTKKNGPAKIDVTFNVTIEI